MKSDGKSLFLVRHAKAEKQWNGISDIDRPLHIEGILEANVIAQKLFERSAKPDLIIASSAQRTVGTAVIFQRHLGVDDAKLKVDHRLYEISFNNLVEFIVSLDEKYQSIMIVGHNPSLSQFANSMDPSILHMPTGSVIKFQYEVEKWRHTSYINAINEYFIYP